MDSRINWLERAEQEMRLRGLTHDTIKSYRSYLRLFADTIGSTHPIEKNANEIRAHLDKLLTSKRLSESSLGQAISAIKFLYREVFHRGFLLDEVHRPRTGRRLPHIMGPEEIQKLFDTTVNLKHKAMMMLCYDGGLRGKELVRVLPTDIDRSRMLTRVDQGKGKKDRYTLLGTKTLGVLREYWKQERPKKWLFEGKTPGKHYSKRSAQEMFKTAVKRAGIRKPVTLHTLRHCFATHLLEDGVDSKKQRNAPPHK